MALRALYAAIGSGRGVGMIATAEITSSRKTGSTRPRGYIEHYSPQQATMNLLNDAIGVIEEYREHWPLTAR